VEVEPVFVRIFGGRYMSWMKLRPIHWGGVVNSPMRQRATMKLVLEGARVANNVMKRDRNMDHQRTGRRPNLCVNGTAINPPTPNILISIVNWGRTKTFPERERPTLSVVSGQ
jgi:hypothetical protein